MSAVPSPHSNQPHGADVGQPDRFDREIVEFLLAWAPYGGPPDDECFPTFGMTLDQLKDHIRTFIEANKGLRMRRDDYLLLAGAARLAGIPESIPTDHPTHSAYDDSQHVTAALPSPSAEHPEVRFSTQLPAPGRVASVEIDRFDREMIEFLLAWAPYGGPPDDECFPTFGMTLDQLKDHVRRLIEDSTDLRMRREDCLLLMRVARLVGIKKIAPAGRQTGSRGGRRDHP